METTRELMSPNPIVVTEETPLAVCAGRMLEHGIRHLPVVDAAGHATHLLTDVAVFRQGGLTGADLELWVPFQGADGPLTAGQLQVEAAVVVRDDEPGSSTLRKLVAADQDVALVVDDTGKLVGILTEHDGVTLAAEVLSDSPLTASAEASYPVGTVGRDVPARDAMATMQSRGIRHLGVVDDENKLVGVVSMGDLLSDQVPNQPSLKVRDVVRPGKPIAIQEGSPLGQAAGQMMATRVGCLPILNERGEPRRILTRTDLIEAALAGIEERAAFGGTDEA